jgi:hypothetical protein
MGYAFSSCPTFQPLQKLRCARVSYHTDFPRDIKRFDAQYREISRSLAIRFRAEVDTAIEKIKAAPGSAGHFVDTGSQIVKKCEDVISQAFPFLSFMVCLEISSLSGRYFRVHLIR